MSSPIRIVVIAALLAGCGRAPAGYDFVTHSLPSGSGMDALLDGSLAITRDEAADAWCLLVVRGSRDVSFVAWPEQFRLILSADGTIAVHGGGRVLRQGDEVRLGGGEVTVGIHHTIPGACESPQYFAVQSLL